MSLEGFVAARLSATSLPHSSSVGRGDESVHFCCIGALFGKLIEPVKLSLLCVFCRAEVRPAVWMAFSFMSVTGERFYGIEAGGAACRQVAEKDTNGS